MDDLISRQKAIMDAESWVAVDEYEKHLQKSVIEWLKEFPPAELGVGTDTISRQAALEKVRTMQTHKLFMGDDMILVDKAEVQTELMMLPSAQPESCERCKHLTDSDRFWICPKCKRQYADKYEKDGENNE